MKKLYKGVIAPGFTYKDILDREIALESYKGKKVILTFYRTASCPFCNLRVHHMIQKSDYFEKNSVQLIGLFASSKEEIMEYAGQQHLSFPIIPDPEENIYRKYGVQKSKWAKLKSLRRVKTIIEFTGKGFLSPKAMIEPPLLPADFLINENGIIDYAYYGKDMGDHLDYKTIDKWIKEAF